MSTHALSISDINTTVNHEPRILDVRLGAALGFKQPRMIRQLIERHKIALERIASVCCTIQQTSSKGGRPANEFYLTKKQALYIVTKSETENAVDLTIHVIEVFDAATNPTNKESLTVNEPTIPVRAHLRRKPQAPLPHFGADELNRELVRLIRIAELVRNGATSIETLQRIHTQVIPSHVGSHDYVSHLTGLMAQVDQQRRLLYPSQALVADVAQASPFNRAREGVVYDS
jgi:hypothetical protein